MIQIAAEIGVQLWYPTTGLQQAKLMNNTNISNENKMYQMLGVYPSADLHRDVLA